MINFLSEQLICLDMILIESRLPFAAIAEVNSGCAKAATTAWGQLKLPTLIRAELSRTELHCLQLLSLVSRSDCFSCFGSLTLRFLLLSRCFGTAFASFDSCKIPDHGHGYAVHSAKHTIMSTVARRSSSKADRGLSMARSVAQLFMAARWDFIGPKAG